MATIVELIRHATSTWVKEADNSPVPLFGGRMNNVGLSKEEGFAEATQLGVFGKRNGISPTLYVSSPAKRTIQTHYVSALEMTGMTIPPQINSQFQEMSWGAWERRPRSIADAPQIVRERERFGFDFAPPGGESYAMVGRRAMSALMELVRWVPDGSYIWVHTHKNVILSAVRPWMGWGPMQISSVKVGVVSRTRFRYQGGKLELISFNQPSI
jgi:broad specificity phosphatase PhoE